MTRFPEPTPAAGVGAAHSWIGNSDVGEGRSTIVQSKPNELVAIKLECVKRFAGMQVNWILEEKNGFIMVQKNLDPCRCHRNDRSQ